MQYAAFQLHHSSRDLVPQTRATLVVVVVVVCSAYGIVRVMARSTSSGFNGSGRGSCGSTPVPTCQP